MSPYCDDENCIDSIASELYGYADLVVSIVEYALEIEEIGITKYDIKSCTIPSKFIELSISYLTLLENEILNKIEKSLRRRLEISFEKIHADLQKRESNIQLYYDEISYFESYIQHRMYDYGYLYYEEKEFIEEIYYTTNLNGYATNYINFHSPMYAQYKGDYVESEKYTLFKATSCINKIYVGAEIYLYLYSCRHMVHFKQVYKNIDDCCKLAMDFASQYGNLVTNENYICVREFLNINNSTINKIADKISDTINDCGIVTATELYTELENLVPDFLSAYKLESPRSVIEFLRNFISDEFCFSYPYITSYDCPVYREKDLIKLFLQTYKQDQPMFSFGELYKFYTSKISKEPSKLNFINDNIEDFALYDKEHLIAWSDVGLNKDDMLQVYGYIADEIKSKESILIRSLESVVKLPKIKYQWSEWLLYSVIKKCKKTVIAKTTSNFFDQALPLVTTYRYRDQKPEEFQYLITDNNYNAKSKTMIFDVINSIDDIDDDILLEEYDGLLFEME